MKIGPVLRAYRRRKLRQMFPDGKISAHFRYIEFYTHDGTPIPIRAVEGIQGHIKRYLDPMRSQFGTCHVLSGYRHEAYNISIGGAKDSRHDWDKHPTATATDLTFARGNPEEWGKYAKRLREKIGYGGIGIYPQSGFIHIDSRTYKADWRQQ